MSTLKREESGILDVMNFWDSTNHRFIRNCWPYVLNQYYKCVISEADAVLIIKWELSHKHNSAI